MWKLLLPPTKGDLTTTYTITVTSDKYGSATINDVLFGDVWVCSGQSNMAFTVKNVSGKTRIYCGRAFISIV